MVDTVTIRINVYNDSASEHVSISLPSGTYENTWSPSNIANSANDFSNIPLGDSPFADVVDAGAQLFIHGFGLFSSSSAAEDGRIQFSDPTRAIATFVTLQVSPEQVAAMDEFARESMGIKNYGLLTKNCVNYVDQVLRAGGVEDNWRQILKDSGSLPPYNPINYLLDPELAPTTKSTPATPSDTAIQTSRDIVGGKLIDISTGKVVYADAITRALPTVPRLFDYRRGDRRTGLKIRTAVSREVKTFAKNRTVIIIVHRSSTIRNADRIIVMDRGQVVGQGTHAALMAAREVYWGVNGDG